MVLRPPAEGVGGVQEAVVPQLRVVGGHEEDGTPVPQPQEVPQRPHQ